MAEDVYKVIFQLEADGKGVFDEINKVKGKYVEVNDEIKRQQAEIIKLQAQEAQLLKARAAANSPSTVAKYNAELANVNKELTKRSAILTAVNKKELELADTTSKFAKQLDATFKGTQVNALNAEIARLSKNFLNPADKLDLLTKKLNALKDVRAAASSEKEFNDLTDEIKSVEAEMKKAGDALEDGFTEPIAKTKSLRAQLKDLKAALAETDDDEEFLRLSIEAGKLEDKIGDAAEAAKIFATDSPFEAVGSAIGSVGSKLLSLDFEGAAKQSQLLVSASSKITFGNALKGIGDLGKTLLNVGKALLTNPLFLIGAAIGLIISNFNELKNSGGIVGSVFKFIGDSIKFVIDLFYTLTDAIGLTTEAFDKFNESALKNSKLLLEQQQKVVDRQIAIAKAAGLETAKLEKEKELQIIKNGGVQLDVYERIKAGGKALTEEQLKDQNDVANAILDAKTRIIAIDAETNKKRIEAAKKYAEERNKIFDDLDKKLREEQQKTGEFNIKVRLPQDSKKQIEETFKLRNKLEVDALNELEKNTLKGLKTKKDRDLAEVKLTQIREQQILNLRNDFDEAVLNANKANGDKLIDARKKQDDLLLDSFIATSKEGTFTEGQQLEKRLDILKKFYADSIALAEKDIKARQGKGFDTTEQEKALAALKLEAATKTAQAEKEINDKKLEEEQKNIDARKAHNEEILKLQNSRNSTLLDNEVEFEKSRLQLLKDSGKEFTDEFQAQQDKVLALEKEAKKQRLLENIGFYEQITAAAIKATNDIINAKLQEIDAQTSLQEKRVEDAKRLAEEGNSALLEEEQKRQDDLLKEREKFVRAQQALAVVELISNSAIAVSKAAAQGGVAAGVTIAATIIALIAGLAQARSIASQAAFYEGGYTGDGNPKEESKAIGKKPYIYHKGEFVFDHKKTQKYKPIFQDIHEGKIDLIDWHEKVKAFNDFGRFAQFDMGAKISKPDHNIINNTIEINQLREQMNTLIHAVKSQGFALNVDGEGFSGYITKMNDRQNFIKNTLAK